MDSIVHSIRTASSLKMKALTSFKTSGIIHSLTSQATYVIRTKKMDTFYINNLIIVSSTCFKYPSVHPQEDLYMQFYGIFSCIHTSSLVDCRMCTYHTTASTSPLEGEHLDVRNMSKTL